MTILFYSIASDFEAIIIIHICIYLFLSFSQLLSFWLTTPYLRYRSDAHTLTLTVTRTPSLVHSLTQSHTLTLTVLLSHTHTHSLGLTLSHTHSLWYTHTHCPALTHTRFDTLIHTLTLTHTHTHTQTHAPTQWQRCFTYSLSLFFFVSREIASGGKDGLHSSIRLI